MIRYTTMVFIGLMVLVFTSVSLVVAVEHGVPWGLLNFAVAGLIRGGSADEVG